MEAHVLLADFAQSDPSGKVNALGLGWSMTSTPMPNHSVVVFLRVAWDETNVRQHLLLQLLTADEHDAVSAPTPFGTRPLRVEVQFEVGRPPGLAHGSTVDHSIAVNIAAGLALVPGRYEWRLQVNEDAQDDWRAPFTVRAEQGQQP